jgi:hypothetical protein
MTYFEHEDVLDLIISDEPEAGGATEGKPCFPVTARMGRGIKRPRPALLTDLQPS